MSIAGKRLRKHRNSPPPDEPWIWLTREILESEAWRTLTLAARRVIERIIIEHMNHAGTENGELVVTYTDFIKFGLRRSSIAAAIANAASHGLIAVTQKGRPSTGPDRWPSRYALGWLPMNDGTAAANRWKAWTKPEGPIPGNIESSNGSGTRKNRRKDGSLVPKTSLAPGSKNDTGKVAETDGLPIPDLVLGEKIWKRPVAPEHRHNDFDRRSTREKNRGAT